MRWDTSRAGGVASHEGMIDEADRRRSQVIAGFNGEFLRDPGRVARERLALSGVLGRADAETAKMPCGLIFNQCPRDAWVREAIEVGFNLVMPVVGGDGVGVYAHRVVELTFE